MTDRIEVEVSPTVDKSAVSKIEKDLESAGSRGGEKFEKGFSEKLSAINVAIGASIATFAVRALDALGRAAGESVQNLRDFSRGVAEVNSILPANEKLTRESTQSLIAFSSQFATGSAEQAKAFYNIISSGVKGTANQIEILRVSNAAAVAGLVDIDKAAKVIVSSMNAYSRAGLTATEASDSLFVAVREGQLNFNEMAEFIGNVTGVAAAAGLTFNELTGAIAAFTNQGLATDIAVVGLRQVLVSVIKPTKEAADEANRLGLEFSTTALKSKGLAGFIKDVSDKTNDNSESLARLFGNVRALTPIITTINGNFEAFNKILDETKNSAGATAEAFKIISENFDFQLKRRAQEFKTFFLQIGISIRDTFGNSALSALPSIQTLQEAFIALGRVLNVAVLLPLEILFNLGKIIFNGFALQVQIVVVAFAKLGEAIARVANFFGLDNALTKGIKVFAETSVQVLNEMSAKLTESINSAFDTTIFGKTGEFLTNFENNLVLAQELADRNRLNIPGVTGPEVEGGDSPVVKQTQEINALSAAFGGLGEGFTSAAKTSGEAIEGLAKRAVEAGKQMRAGLAGGISQGFAAFGAAIVKGENALDAFVRSFLSSLGQMAIQQGAFFILEGLGLQFVPGLQAQGAALIGVGAAMSALGGALTAIGGGGQGVGAVGINTNGGGVGSFNNDFTEQAEERENRPPEVSLTIQGNVFDSKESGLQIVKILNEAFESQGAVLRGFKTV